MTFLGMDREKWLVTGMAGVLLLVLFVGGRRTPGQGPSAARQTDSSHTHQGFDIAAYLDTSLARLDNPQGDRARAMTLALSRARADEMRQDILDDLADFWRDSARNTLAYLWYNGEGAKLENSEKSLTFAAHAYLFELRGETEPGLKSWMALQARSLYKSALAINPKNDSATVGYGSTYFFVTAEGGTPMEGILKIREVAERDSTNLFAQFMLGYGGLVSGQYDRAADRFERVLKREPGNKEAVFLMAEACERSGNREKALYWYRVGRNQVDNPDVIRAIDEKIGSLQ
jgi:tetratricopeptide (TPR) repeat protein